MTFSYFDLKESVWNALSNGASESIVMNRLTDLHCSYLECAPEKQEYRHHWLMAQACNAMRDGINGATYVRLHPSTEFSRMQQAHRKRVALRQTDRFLSDLKAVFDRHYPEPHTNAARMDVAQALARIVATYLVNYHPGTPNARHFGAMLQAEIRKYFEPSDASAPQE